MLQVPAPRGVTLAEAQAGKRRLTPVEELAHNLCADEKPWNPQLAATGWREDWACGDIKKIPRTHWYRWSPTEPWRGPVTLQKSELLIPMYDPVWEGMRGTHYENVKLQAATIQKCCEADGVDLLFMLSNSHLVFCEKNHFYNASYWLVMFNTVRDAFLFKLKWPGTAIGANK